MIAIAAVALFTACQQNKGEQAASKSETKTTWTKIEPQDIEKLCPCPEGAADSRNARALTERQRCRDIQHLVHLRFLCLRHPAPGIGGKRFEITPGPFRVQNAEGQGGLPGAGNTCDPHDLVQRDVHVDIFEIMNPAAAHLDVCRGLAAVCFHCNVYPLLSYGSGPLRSCLSV